MARTPGSRAGTTKVVIWLGLAVVAVIGTEIGLATTQSPKVRAPTSAQLLSQTLTVAGAADAFHYRAVWRANGVTQVVVGDARPSSGSESIVVGDNRFTAVFNGQTAYFEGNAAALRDQLGLSAVTASANDDKWISLQPSDGPYGSVEEGVTTTAALAEVVIAPTSTSHPRRAHGVVVSRITGRIPHGRVVTGSAHLDLVARSKLPTTYVAQGSNGGEPWSSTIVFSRWGVTVGIQGPKAGSLPFSSLQGPAPGPKSTSTERS